MLPEEQELSYLWDMREAAREVRAFVKDVRFAKLEKNKVLRYAVERQLLVICEAANHISPQYRKKHPEISWTKIIGLRNILAHEYGKILIARVWLAATEATPELLKSLAELLPD